MSLDQVWSSTRVCPWDLTTAYSAEFRAAIAEVLVRDAAAGIKTWCIFDNTAAFAATADALTTRSLVQARGRGSRV
ncbi:hypothetical protein [Microvirga makkahensis]|uniref:hypothetical protein n=1 Tax=Microvirga makkahensis TaxID=1128670 RepID=UPI00197C181D|nr:hypothetical protein [Microvirga makkahensis]